MASRRNPRAANPSVPFHEDLRRLRETAFVMATQLATTAGCTVGQYCAMELGQVPCSRAVYDAAIQRFPQLRAHPRPPPDPAPTNPQIHPAVTAEREREDAFLATALRLNVGTTNRSLIAQLLHMAIDGQMTHDDVKRFIR